MNIAVFVSGRGSNLKALISGEEKGRLAGGRIALVVSDNPGAKALDIAREKKVETFVLEKGSVSGEEYDRKVIKRLKERDIKLVVLAGFMRILSGCFIDEYEGRILNVHPALLPAFKGAQGIKDAHEYGVKVTGVSIHFVTKELDAGPVILQSCVKVEEGEGLQTLEDKIHKEEHRLYPEAVRLFVQGKLRIEGRKVKILE